MENIIIAIDYISTNQLIRFTTVSNISDDFISNETLEVKLNQEIIISEWLTMISKKYKVDFLIIDPEYLKKINCLKSYTFRSIDDMIFVLVSLDMDRIEIDEFCINNRENDSGYYYFRLKKIFKKVRDDVNKNDFLDYMLFVRGIIIGMLFIGLIVFIKIDKNLV